MLKFTLLSLLLAVTLLSLITTIAVAQDKEAAKESPDHSSEESDEDSVTPSRTLTMQIDGREYVMDFKELKCVNQQFIAGFTCVEKEEEIVSNGNVTDRNY